MGDWTQYLDEPAPPTSAPAAGDESWRKYLDPEPGYLEAGLRGLKQGATFGFGDELTGLAESALTRKTYKQARDEARANDQAAEEAHPVVYGAGELGGGLATALVPGGAAARGALAGVKGAALAGAAYGAGSSEADLTEGDVGGLARDTAVGAGAGVVAHGAVKVAGKAVKAVAPKARAALEKYARSETEDLLGGAAKSAAGRAALGAGAGLYSGDEDQVGSALKGAALAVAVPAAHRAASKAVKAAILAALERGGRKEAAKVAQAVSAARAHALAEVDPALLDAAEPALGIAGKPPRLALAEYTPPGAKQALPAEAERLALPPVPPAEGRGIRLGPGAEGEASTAAIPLPEGHRPPRWAKPPQLTAAEERALDAEARVAAPVKLGTRVASPEELAGVTSYGKPLEQADLQRMKRMRAANDLDAIHERGGAQVPTVVVSPGGIMDVEDGRHRILAARERGKPLKVSFVRGSAAMDEAAPAVAKPSPLKFTVGEPDDDGFVRLDAHQPDGARAGHMDIWIGAPGTADEPGIARAGYVQVPQGMRRKGYGTELYREAAKISEERFGRRLLSDADADGGTAPEAIALWRKLVAAGDAEVRPDGGFAMKPRVAPASNAAKETAIAEFKEAVAKSRRLADSGDKVRSASWLKAAEKKFKAAMKGAK